MLYSHLPEDGLNATIESRVWHECPGNQRAIVDGYNFRQRPIDVITEATYQFLETLYKALHRVPLGMINWNGIDIYSGKPFSLAIKAI